MVSIERANQIVTEELDAAGWTGTGRPKYSKTELHSINESRPTTLQTEESVRDQVRDFIRCNEWRKTRTLYPIAYANSLPFFTGCDTLNESLAMARTLAASWQVKLRVGHEDHPIETWTIVGD